MILSLTGWAGVIVLLAGIVAAITRAVRHRDYVTCAIAGLYACAAVILLAILGVLPAPAAAVYALLALAVPAGIAAKAGGREAAGAFLGFMRAAVSYLTPGGLNMWRSLAALADRYPGEGDGRGGGAAPAGTPAAEVVAGRSIPSLGADPALGVPPEPAAVATVAPVPAPYAALASWIAGFEPEDDQDLRMFMEANAAGSVAVADAWHQHGEACLNSAGLHPAYVAGILEVGDREAESGSWKVHAHRRFAVIYGAVKEWIGANGPLPHKAREFLTGEESA